MKMIVVALALVAAVVAAPPAAPAETAQIVRSEYNQSPEGGYVFSYETDNGIQRQETGDLKEILDEENKPHQVVVSRGSFSYIDPEGNTQTVNYYADDKGFHAEGPSIPKLPGAERK